MALLVDQAERAERLRQEGASVVFLTGSEISLFNSGFLSGDNHADRLGALTDPVRRTATLPEVGCAVYRGAADRASRSGETVEYDEHTRPARLTAAAVPDTCWRTQCED